MGRSRALIALKTRAIDSSGSGQSQLWCDFFSSSKKSPTWSLAKTRQSVKLMIHQLSGQEN